MVSNLEKRISRSLRSLLENVADGSALDRDSEAMRDVLDRLEWWLPTILAEVYPFWKGEELDGFYLAFASKTGPSEAELAGACILINDQTITPFQLRLQVARDMDEIAWLECRVGDAGTGKGGIRRAPCVSTKVIYAVVDRPDSIHWVYRVTFGEKQRDTEETSL
jgi:hypothetical protein